MAETTASAAASPNIAFIKYWGNRDHDLRIPANPSLSMTLAGLETYTDVTLLGREEADVFKLNGEIKTGPGLERVSTFLEYVRSLADSREGAHVESVNNFPTGVGIASSASAFAALAIAACAAYSLDLPPTAMSRLARRGSGSAARSIFGGYVELLTGDQDSDAYARQIFPAEHWELHDWIAVLDTDHKSIGSTAGHRLADSSPIQPARVEDASRRIQICIDALEKRDFNSFAKVVEQDSNLMHAVMMTSTPSLFYLHPSSLLLMRKVQSWRQDGLEACFTIDAGPNVHVVCTPNASDEVEEALRSIESIRELIHTKPGPGSRLRHDSDAMSR